MYKRILSSLTAFAIVFSLFAIYAPEKVKAADQGPLTVTATVVNGSITSSSASVSVGINTAGATIQNFSGTISWTNQTNPGVGNGSDTIGSNGGIYPISGLDSGSMYSFQVTISYEYEGDFSIFLPGNASTGVSFTTPAAPPPASVTVNSVVISNVGASTANVTANFTTTNCAALNTSYFTVTPNNGVSISAPTLSANSLNTTLSGLVSGTSYTITAYINADSNAAQAAGQATHVHPIASAAPTVSVGTPTFATSGSYANVTFSGTVTNAGSQNVTDAGFVYSTSSSVTPALKSDGTAATSCTKVSVTSNILANAQSTPLSGSTGYIITPGSTVYVRAYAISSVGTAYSTTTASVTTSSSAAITTTSATTTSPNKASVVVNATGSSYTKVGVVYSKTASTPTYNSTGVYFSETTTSATGNQTFYLTNLEPGVTYYVRGYVWGQNIGYVYDTTTPKTFYTTPTGIPSVTTVSAYSTSEYTGDVEINVTNVGTGTTSGFVRGVVYSTTDQTPTLKDLSKAASSGTTGNATVSLTGLTNNTTYYVRAYATNSYGTAYGTVRSFTTSPNASGVTTSTPTNIMADGATVSISITVSNSITSHGVVYSKTNSESSLRVNTTNVNYVSSTSSLSTGTKTHKITGLDANTTYYVRGFTCRNNTYTYDTSWKSFTTLSSSYLPTVTTSSATRTSTNAIDVDMNVTAATANVSSSTLSVSSRGVVYSTSDSNPKLGATNVSSKTASGSGTGTATVSLTGLTSGSTYYVRAYATNSYGTAYGAVKTVTAGASGITTNTPTNITATSATLGGSVSSDINSSVTERGVVYSRTNAEPTISDMYQKSTVTTYGAYSITLTGLEVDTKYYARAYIKTASGYSYGSVITFTTTAYSFANGTGTYTKGSGTGLTVTIQRSYSLFKDVQIRNTSLTWNTDYKASEGSTIITLQTSYLERLSTGQHTMYVNFYDDTYVAVEFKVVEKPTVLAPQRSAGTKVTSTLSKNTLILNGKSTSFPAVNIDGYNYLKLRDIAALLNGTQKQFSIGFNSITNVITISSGRAYSPIGDELSNTLSGFPIATATPQRLTVDGTTVSVAAYNINGYNYFRLRDLAILLNFGVTYNDANSTITLLLDRPYSE